MSERRRIYLDNAATSWPKPEAVYLAVDRYQRENGAPAGRSSYSHAAEVQRIVARARTSIARLIGAPAPRHIVFTRNGTESLNLAIHGLLRPGDHAICSEADHNSILRPLRRQEEHEQVEVTRISCDSLGRIDPDDVRRALKANTRLVALLHASNVTGVIQPIAEIGRIVREHPPARLLIDAAQSVGHMPVRVDDLSADFVAAPGHKGLLGPLGTGFLYIRPDLEREVNALYQGGTGTHSERDRHPDDLPDKFEAGNLNILGLVGLAAGLDWIAARGIESIHTHEQQLAGLLRTGLASVAGVQLHAADGVGVVSISMAGYDPQEAAAALDASFGVQVRAGLHCAPKLHRAMGSLTRGGTVRLSLGALNIEEDVQVALAAVTHLATTT